MYTLIVKGPRRATLSWHKLSSYRDVEELLAVYHALGYKPESLVVEETQQQEAA